MLHNLVHLAFGGGEAALSRSAARAMTYLPTGGVIYVVLRLYGVFIDRDSGANFVPINSDGNWRHLILGLGNDRSSCAPDPKAPYRAPGTT
ncbi:DUF4383 domain-containing protein [Streptomyces sp. NPDC001914]|uniref:DUF4383 domain-containing protein n=1 Tax=Streptomyces sp. NPDC001914 TaxID=3364623 RepID=UPI00369BF78E